MHLKHISTSVSIWNGYRFIFAVYTNFGCIFDQKYDKMYGTMFTQHCQLRGLCG